MFGNFFARAKKLFPNLERQECKTLEEFKRLQQFFNFWEVNKEIKFKDKTLERTIWEAY